MTSHHATPASSSWGWRRKADVNEEPPRQGRAGEGQGVPAPAVPADAAAAAEEDSTSGEEEVVVAPPTKRKRANRIPKKIQQAGAVPQQQAGAAPQQQAGAAPQAGADPLQAPQAGPSGLQRAPEQSIAWQNAFISASAAMESANQEKLKAEAEREEAQRERDHLQLQLQNLNNGGAEISRTPKSICSMTELSQRLQVQEQQQQPQPQREQLFPGGRLGCRSQETQQVRARPLESIQVPSLPVNIYFNKKDDKC